MPPIYIILAAIPQRKSLTAVLMIVECSKFASGSIMTLFHKFPDLFQNVSRYGHPKANPSQVVCISTLFWNMNQRPPLPKMEEPEPMYLVERNVSFNWFHFLRNSIRVVPLNKS